MAGVKVFNAYWTPPKNRLFRTSDICDTRLARDEHISKLLKETERLSAMSPKPGQKSSILNAVSRCWFNKVQIRTILKQKSSLRTCSFSSKNATGVPPHRVCFGEKKVVGVFFWLDILSAKRVIPKRVFRKSVALIFITAKPTMIHEIEHCMIYSIVRLS